MHDPQTSRGRKRRADARLERPAAARKGRVRPAGRPPVYDYSPLDAPPAQRFPGARGFVRRYGPLALGVGVLVLVTVLALMSEPGGEEEVSDEELALLIQGHAPEGERAREGVTTGISVITYPTGADVAVEFEHVGTSPVDPIALAAGSYFVSLTKPGYVPLDTLVFVDHNEVSSVYVALQRSEELAGAAAGGRGGSEQGPEALLQSPSPPQAPPPSVRRDVSRSSARRSGPRRDTPASSTRSASASEDSPSTTGEGEEVVTEGADRRAAAVPLARSEPVTVGSVRVSSEPSGATVLLNGVPVGTTPTTLYRVTPDEYTLALELDGFATHSERVDVLAGQEVSVGAALVQAVGEVEVVVRPWGSIFIDGTLHRADTDVAYRAQVLAGTRVVRAVHPSLGVQERTIDVPVGGVKRIVIDMNGAQ